MLFTILCTYRGSSEHCAEVSHAGVEYTACLIILVPLSFKITVLFLSLIINMQAVYLL